MLSVVILTCNSQEHIQACLNSVFRQNTRGVEVIIVDNASSDKTLEIIRGYFPRLELIENSSNLGASKARNQGVECSSGDWILTLDSDVMLKDNFFEKFNSIQKEFPEDIGMVQPNVLNMDGKTIYSHGIYLSAFRRFHDLNRGRLREGARLMEKSIIGPCSAAAFYKRSMLNELKERTGYFDERFFFLVEDVDLAWRAQRAGWKVLFDAQMECLHAGNGSGTGEKLRQYLSFRNRHWMIAKNENFWGKVRVYILSAPYELMRGISLAIFNKYFWMKS